VIERFNQTLKTMLYKWMQETGRADWMVYLPKAVEIYNRMEHRSTKQVPFELWFGRSARVFVELDNPAQNHVASKKSSIDLPKNNKNETREHWKSSQRMPIK